MGPRQPASFMVAYICPFPASSCVDCGRATANAANSARQINGLPPKLLICKRCLQLSSSLCVFTLSIRGSLARRTFSAEGSVALCARQPLCMNTRNQTRRVLPRTATSQDNAGLPRPSKLLRSDENSPSLAQRWPRRLYCPRRPRRPQYPRPRSIRDKKQCHQSSFHLASSSVAERPWSRHPEQSRSRLIGDMCVSATCDGGKCNCTLEGVSISYQIEHGLAPGGSLGPISAA
jgi:hypothetical protein